MRGERGDTRELRPQVFFLKCPSCGIFRDCANVKLFTTTARGLTCSTCRKSTSSTRWCCEHGTPWTSCLVHRETGFRCGAQRLHLKKATSKGSLWVRSLKALKGRQARLSRLGSLGEPKRLLDSYSNSVGSSTKRGTMVQKKIIKRRGKRPPRKGEGGGGRLGVLNKSPTCLVLGIGNEQHAEHDYYHHSTSIYWQAHSHNGLPEGNASSDIANIKAHHEAGSDFARPHKPAKRARTCAPSFTQAPACKGNCPRVWTIESYCELCHG